MPWDHCNQSIADDRVCPSCGITKEAWTVEVNVTRTFRVTSRKRKAKKQAWVAFRLEEDGDPVGEEEYELELPEGRVVTGKLDPEGRARHEGIYPGECRIKFAGGEALHTAEGEEEPDEDGWLPLSTDTEHLLERREQYIFSL